jgi:hypothetical protein
MASSPHEQSYRKVAVDYLAESGADQLFAVMVRMKPYLADEWSWFYELPDFGFGEMPRLASNRFSPLNHSESGRVPIRICARLSIELRK